MKMRTMTIGAVTAMLLAVPSIAEAPRARTTGTVNLRTGPSTGYAKVATLPAGARISVGGNIGGWYHVSYNGLNGFVTGSCVSMTFVDRGPGFNRLEPAPRFGFMQRPWWDNQHQD